jgi:drug/metabolite transporter (DMT)-like permease
MGVVFGLIAALGWGIGDFYSRFISRQLGAFRAVFYSSLVAFLGTGAYVQLSGDLAQHLAGASPKSWLWALLSSALGTVASLALFRAFEHGVLALVSPIVASYSAVTVLLAVWGGERLGGGQWAGILVLLVAVALASLEPRPRGPLRLGSGLPPGVGWALLASLSYGVSFWLLGSFVVDELGSVVPRTLGLLVTLLLLWAAHRPLNEGLGLPPKNTWGLILSVTLMTNVAAICANLGLEVGPVGLVTVISSLFSAVTVLLAWLLLRERLAPHQWAGVVLALVGIVLVNLE